MLASSCPGFVCYVEKTIPTIISNLCTVKSPMAIAGSMFKHDLIQDSRGEMHSGSKFPSHEQNLNVYHVAIMPCHDKKLEAERKDLVWEKCVEEKEEMVKDVDLVITTNELFSVLVKDALDGSIQDDDDDISNILSKEHDEDHRLHLVKKYFSNLQLSPCNTWSNALKDDGVYISRLQKSATNETNSKTSMEESIAQTLRGSGSYAEFIFRFASEVLFDHHIPNDQALPWKSVTRRGLVGQSAVERRIKVSQNEASVRRIPISDQSEVTLYKNVDGTFTFVPVSEGSVGVLRFASAYGFKNIQLQMQRLSNMSQVKKSDENYHYIETMACPSGCLNGGGQIKLDSLLDSSHMKMKRKEKPSEKRSRVLKGTLYIPNNFPNIIKEERAMRKICEEKFNLLHTRFHVVPKLELDKGSTAGVSVNDTIW